MRFDNIAPFPSLVLLILPPTCPSPNLCCQYIYRHEDIHWNMANLPVATPSKLNDSIQLLSPVNSSLVKECNIEMIHLYCDFNCYGLG